MKSLPVTGEVLGHRSVIHITEQCTSFPISFPFLLPPLPLPVPLHNQIPIVTLPRALGECWKLPSISWRSSAAKLDLDAL